VCVCERVCVFFFFFKSQTEVHITSKMYIILLNECGDMLLVSPFILVAGVAPMY